MKVILGINFGSIFGAFHCCLHCSVRTCLYFLLCLFNILFPSAYSFWYIIFHHYNIPFYFYFFSVIHFFSLRSVLLMLLTTWDLFIYSNSNNSKIVKLDFCVISWQTSHTSHLISKISLKKVPVMTNNTLTWADSFIDIYAFWDIISIIHQQLFPTQLIYTNMHLKKCMYSMSSIIIILCNPSIFFKGKSSSELNLIFFFIIASGITC